ncbi:hypothetical protein M2139_001458 [Enterococcus sp. PF1-24]|uniref:Ig-like domain-containing protein n=1 Tax=unclassified Enterococcus TaxID=2608891 RepID=UPI0024770808|nr:MULTISPECIES: Ig-like domain-containing protein [unclassified Enterococcus]MDH6364403.1 hypothetical protein [Enterococcus sp. PFB1-1]MDH6401574.1 hypothetical protein [Enterococcus sp. PF1-24]
MEKNEKASQYLLSVYGELDLQNSEEPEIEVALSDNFVPDSKLTKDESTIFSENNQKIGEYQFGFNNQQQQILTLDFANAEEGVTDFHFTLYGDVKNPQEDLVFADEKGRLLTFPAAVIPQPETTETSNKEAVTKETDEKTTATTDSTSEKVEKNDKTDKKIAAALEDERNRNINDLFSKYAPGQNFVTNITQEFDPDPATIDSDIHFHMDFSIPDSVRGVLKAGDYYEMELPAGIKVTDIQEGDLVNEAGEVYGHYVIDPTDNKVKITFTNNQDGEFLPASGGGINYTSHFDEEVITTPGDKTFIIQPILIYHLLK